MSEQAEEEERRRKRFYAIKRELAVVGTQARIAARAQSALTTRWRNMHYALALPSAVLAALAGAAILTDLAGQQVAGALAVASAICSSLLATFNPPVRVATAVDSARNYLNIENEAQYVENVELYGEEDIDKASSSLERIKALKNDTNLRADLPPRRLWNRAVKAEDGLTAYGDIREFLDDESYARVVARDSLKVQRDVSSDAQADRESA